MLTILRREKPNIEQYFESHSLEIVEELFKNVWNAGKFKEMFEIDVEFMADDSTIDYNTFTQSLEYIRVWYLESTKVHLNAKYSTKLCVFTAKILEAIKCYTPFLCSGPAKSHQHIVRIEIGFTAGDL